MDCLLIAALFLTATYGGHLLMHGIKPKFNFKLTGNQIVIEYRKRTLIVTGDRNIRLVSYKRYEGIEEIKIPIGNGKETAKQVERFFINTPCTSLLSKVLFGFSKASDPFVVIRFDSELSNELIEVRDKLHTFCKMK